MKTFTCFECGRTLPVKSSGGTGYARDNSNRAICYDCCADRDRETMEETGRIALYLTGREIINWPGTLRFPVRHSRLGRHNLSGTRTDVWFQGPDGAEWHGVQYGKFSQICRCKRLKP